MKRIVVLSAIFGLLAPMVPAQEAAPLIRRPSSVTVRKIDPDERREVKDDLEDTGVEIQATPEPTPDPSTVFVAIVNNHRMTREQLDRRLAAVTRLNPEILEGDNSATNNVLEIIGGDLSQEDLQRQEIEQFQDQQLREAMRQEEDRIITEWQEHMMLADEARRHGFVIGSSELQLRMAQLEQEFDLQNQRVDNLLEAQGMTRAELESFVYDALLIEKLLERFMDLNYTDADWYNMYEQNKAAYRTPPQYRIAHFTVAMLGNENPTAIRKFKNQTQEIRKRLDKGEDPQKIMDEFNNIEFGYFGTEIYWSTESTVQNRNREDHNLPDVVVEELKKMKVGEVSDVLENKFMASNGKEYFDSFHVIKVLEYIPEFGTTYKEAEPIIKSNAMILSREVVLKMIIDAKTHKRIVRLSGIRPDKMPSREELTQFRQPINLKLGS